MSWVGWLTLAGIGVYAAKLFWDIGCAAARGEIGEADIAEAARCSVDSDTYDGSYGTRDGEVWCELCHRYHSA